MTSKYLAGIVTAFTLTLAGGVGYIAWTMKLSPAARVTAQIKEWANEPESVKLRGLRQSARDPDIWCGEVNARNRMGGMVGFERFYFEQSQYEDPEMRRIFSKMVLEGNEKFPNGNRLFCE